MARLQLWMLELYVRITKQVLPRAQRTLSLRLTFLLHGFFFFNSFSSSLLFFFFFFNFYFLLPELILRKVRLFLAS
jgi:hypothetical protein